MRNGVEFSTHQQILITGTLIAGALGLAACSTETTPPNLDLVNQLNDKGVEQVCLDLRQLYLDNLGQTEDDSTGGAFQTACLEALPKLNGPTTCSTETNANVVGFKTVQASFKNAKLSSQAIHANARNITRDGQRKAWDACINPRLVRN